MIARRETTRAILGLFLALVAGMLLTTISAQRGAGGRSGSGGGGAAPQFTRLEILETGFKFTKDQKKAVKTILDDAHKSAAPIREALTRTRGAIAAAIQANKPQPEIDAAVNHYAEPAAAMTALEMKSLAQMLQALDKDQRANAAGVRSAFFLMRGIFLDNKRWDDIPDSRSY